MCENSVCVYVCVQEDKSERIVCMQELMVYVGEGRKKEQKEER